MPHIQANGVRLYYEVRGDGPPLTLIEGIGYASWMWFRQVDALAARHRLVIYDNRGVGRSEGPPVPYSVRDLADDLVRLLDGLGVERTHLLGVSAGGFIAQQFALSYPDRVEKLVLVATAMYGHADRIAMPQETRRLMVPDLSLPPEPRIRKAMSVAFAPGFAESHPEVVDAVLEMRLESPPQPIEAYMRHARANIAFDASAQVASIAAPALVLHGDQDRVIPVDNARDLASRLSNAELRILTGGGHLAFMEQPESFNRAVLEFLE
jgi:pimeloyl-ACP methyl ester carboxylesterase